MRTAAMDFSLITYFLLSFVALTAGLPAQTTLLNHASNNTSVSSRLFAELEELARIVDISYCVGLTGLGIQKPFQCVSRCAEFEDFELLTVGILIIFWCFTDTDGDRRGIQGLSSPILVVILPCLIHHPAHGLFWPFVERIQSRTPL
jgi:hypothetical protein